MTKTFVKLLDGGLSYEIFRNPIQVGGRIRFVNSDAGKNELGYYELDQSYPTVDTGWHAVRKSWTYDPDLNKIVGVFDIVEDEKIPRVFSKYKLMTYMMEVGMWDVFKSWINDSGQADFWDVPLEFREDDPYFKIGVEAFCQKFNVGAEELETILSSCIKDPS